MNPPKIDWATYMPGVAMALLGEPTFRATHDWRYGQQHSLSIDIHNGRWYDHEAGEGGGVLDLVARKRHMTHGDAAHWILNNIQEAVTATPSRTEHVEKIELARRLWNSAERAREDCIGTKYITDRHIWPRNKQLPPAVRWISPQQIPKSLRPKNAVGVLLFQYQHVDTGNITAISMMAFNTDGQRIPWFKHAAKSITVGPRSKSVCLMRGSMDCGTLHLCEGECDAIALATRPPWCMSGAVIAMGGAGELGKAAEAFKSLIEQRKVHTIIVHPDYDAAGGRAVQQIKMDIQKYAISVHIERNQYKDDPATRVARWRNENGY